MRSTACALGILLAAACGEHSEADGNSPTVAPTSTALPSSLSSCIAESADSCSAASATVQIVDWVGNSDIRGLSVGTCPALDVPADPAVACAAALPVSQSAASNPVTIPLPANCGFRVFMTAIDTPLIPLDWYFSPSPHGALGEPNPAIRMMTRATLSALFANFGVTLSTGAPFAILRVFDCDGAPVAGVTFTVSSQSAATPFTIQQGAVSLSPITDASGQFGFANLAPGPVTVQAEMGGAKLGDPVTFAVRADWGTLVDIRPRTAAK